MAYMEFHQIIGIIANIMFGIKSAPQCLKCYKNKSAKELSTPMLILDFGGNIGCTYYIYSTVHYEVVFQFINYGLATLFLVVLFVMKFIYRNNSSLNER